MSILALQLYNIDIKSKLHSYKVCFEEFESSLLETVDREKITLILPNGKYSESLDQYKKVNFDWFSDNDWSIEYEIIDKNVTKEMGIILTKITYFDKDEKGKPYSFQYFLTLVFQVIEQEWKLVFDQNTIIK